MPITRKCLTAEPSLTLHHPSIVYCPARALLLGHRTAQQRHDHIVGFSSCSLSPVALSPTNPPTHLCSIPIGIIDWFVILFSNFSLRDSQENSSPSLCFDILHPMAAPSTPLPLPSKSTSFSCCFIVVLPNTFSLCKYKYIFF